MTVLDIVLMFLAIGFFGGLAILLVVAGVLLACGCGWVIVAGLRWVGKEMGLLR